MRAAPTVMIRPMIGVAEAVHKTLHGIDNTIDKQKREKLKDVRQPLSYCYGNSQIYISTSWAA